MGKRRVVIRLDSGPAELMKTAGPKPFVCSLVPLRNWPPPEPVRHYGTALLDHLLTCGDESVRKAVGHVLDDSGTLYFYLEADTAELQSWEALCKQHFFTLKPDWCIARLVKPNVDPDYSPVPYQPPLRLLALMSAAKIEAAGEWQVLYKASRDAAAAGLRIRLHLLAGEETLVDQIRKESKAKQKNLELSVKPMPTLPVDVEHEINEFRPHLLHFFCHGQVRSGIRELRLADVNGWRKDETFGMSVEMLTSNEGVRGSWLIVINACKGAMAGEQMHSLTHALVAAGVPAACAAAGMMEQIDPLAANKFCEHFYPAVFNEIRSVSARLQKEEVGTGMELEWASTMYEPRAALSQLYPSPFEARQWTLPVLYMRRHGFKVRLTKPTAPKPPAEDIRLDWLKLLPSDVTDRLTNLAGAAVLGK